MLRRTAIKDISAYLGFLVGFIGSAPFAWGHLAVQLEAGQFARGLWYFFGIVTAAGIFAGMAGLGLGAAAGILWELIHRHRRQPRQPDAPSVPVAVPHPLERPRLKLVSNGPPRQTAEVEPAARPENEG